MPDNGESGVVIGRLETFSGRSGREDGACRATLGSTSCVGSFMSDGTSIIRTTVALSSTARARAMPPTSVGGMGPVTPKAIKTTIMIRAALGRPSSPGDAAAYGELGAVGGFVAFAGGGEQGPPWPDAVPSDLGFAFRVILCRSVPMTIEPLAAPDG